MQPTILTDQILKDQILAALDPLPVEALAEVLAYVQSLNSEAAVMASTPTSEPINAAAVESMAESPNPPTESAFLQGYQRSKHNRDEVYRRLANS